jgi:hypothetical protein
MNAHNHRFEDKTHLAPDFAGLRWGTGVDHEDLIDNTKFMVTTVSTASCGAPVHRKRMGHPSLVKLWLVSWS